VPRDFAGMLPWQHVTLNWVLIFVNWILHSLKNNQLLFYWKFYRIQAYNKKVTAKVYVVLDHPSYIVRSNKKLIYSCWFWNSDQVRQNRFDLHRYRSRDPWLNASKKSHNLFWKTLTRKNDTYWHRNLVSSTLLVFCSNWKASVSNKNYKKVNWVGNE